MLRMLGAANRPARGYDQLEEQRFGIHFPGFFVL